MPVVEVVVAHVFSIENGKYSNTVNLPKTRKLISKTALCEILKRKGQEITILKMRDLEKLTVKS